MKTTTLSLTFPLFVFLILLKAVEAFLPKVLGHVQISAAAVTVDTLEIGSFSANFGSTLTAHRIDIMLLNLQNDDAFLPCLVLELLADGRNQTKRGVFPDACLDDIAMISVVFGQHQNAGILFFAVINDLAAELMCIMLMEISQFLPVAVICFCIAATTMDLFGSVDPLINLTARIGVFSSPFYIEGTRSFSGRIEDTAHCTGVLSGKNRGTYFIFCCNAFAGATSVCYWYFPWDMKFHAVFLKNQRRGHHLSFFRNGIATQTKSGPLPSFSIPEL